jgi:hypothetical protein
MPNPDPSPAPEPIGDEAVQADRKKRTLLLIAGGAVSLILPACGAVYLYMKESGESRAPNSSVMFERREAGDAKVAITQAVTINPGAEGLATAAVPAGMGSSMPSGAPQTTAGGSLGMVKGDGDFLEGDKKAEAPAASTQTAAAKAPPVEEGGPIAAKKGQKAGPKPFAMPKLQGGKGFTSFKGVAPKGGGGGGMDDMLKNLPPGAENNPEVQKLLQQQGR